MISEFLTRGTPSATQNVEQTTEVEQQFFRFHLVPDTNAMLPVHQMTEVLSIPITQVVPIPNMPAWVMGVYNWRGDILWVVDLGNLLGLAPLYQQAVSRSSHTVIVIHGGKQLPGNQVTGGKMLGLVVSQVEDLESCNADLIQSPPVSAITPELVPFMRGYWLKPNGDMLLVLDGDSLIAGMP